MAKKPVKQNMNLVKLASRFNSEERCRDYLRELRWPDGVRCPRCDSDSMSWISTRNQHDCNQCRYRFSVTTGSILHDSHLPLTKWFMAAYLMIEAKKGISANQLARTIDVSYRTAWYLCHRIRAAMADAFPLPLKDRVEVDETYIGGEARGQGRGFTGNKSVVVGAVQRDGKIVLQVVSGRDRKSLHAFIKEHVHDDAEAIYTDEWAPYRGIADHNTRHETVNHSEDEWVRGDVHTNSVESVWSLFKRSIVGTFHKMSAKHLQAYLEEMEWRFNNRDNPFLFRDTVQRLIDADNLEYKKLTA